MTGVDPPSKAQPSAPTPGNEHESDIGWLRAIATGLAVLIVGIAASVLGANRILTKALGVTRGGREALATALVLLVVVVLAWALRQLQARGLI